MDPAIALAGHEEGVHPGSLGLISRGDKAGGFTITGEDGRVWELNSKKVHLADHVGHTVTVTGTAGKTSKAQEEKIEAHEKERGRRKGTRRLAGRQPEDGQRFMQMKERFD